MAYTVIQVGANDGSDTARLLEDDQRIVYAFQESPEHMNLCLPNFMLI
jgi:hypothetical protein